MSDQATEQSVESRLATFFGGDAPAPAQQPEVALPTAEEAPAEDVQAAEVEAEAADQPDEPESDGYEEIDLDGETYRVPPKLKEAVLRQSDYTRKTQEVAEVSRMLQAYQQQAVAQQQFQAATAQDVKQLQEVESQLAQYKQLDWAQMDMEALTKARFRMDELREMAESLRHGLNAKAAQFQEHLKSVRQQQLQQGLEYLRKSIPKFDGETVGKLRDYALNEGFLQPELEQINDPRLVKLLWKASQYDSLKANQKAAVEAVKKAPPVIKPGATKGPSAVAQARYKDVRQRLSKSGDVRDAARLIAMRMK